MLSVFELRLDYASHNVLLFVLGQTFMLGGDQKETESTPATPPCRTHNREHALAGMIEKIIDWEKSAHRHGGQTPLKNHGER